MTLRRKDGEIEAVDLVQKGEETRACERGLERHATEDGLDLVWKVPDW